MFYCQKSQPVEVAAKTGLFLPSKQILQVLNSEDYKMLDDHKVEGEKCKRISC